MHTPARVREPTQRNLAVWIPSLPTLATAGRKHVSVQSRRRACQLRVGDLLCISLSVRVAARDTSQNIAAVTLGPPPPKVKNLVHS